MLEKWYVERVRVPGYDEPLLIRGDSPATLRNCLLDLANEAKKAAQRVERESNQ